MNDLMKKQLVEMFELQESLNSVVSDKWRDNNNNWPRAIWVESAEMLDHYGWKWWKHQECDLEQVKLEIVDVWHFVMSWWLQTNEDPVTECGNCIKDIFVQETNVPELIESISGYALVGYINMTTDSLFRLMDVLDMSFDELYQWYVGKNVLNQFRQDNGYKEGTYRKLWAGVEDNVHLANIIDEVYEISPNNFRDALYNQLTSIYATTNE